MNYNINFRIIGANLIPSFLRGSTFLSLIYSLIKALKDVNLLLYAITQRITYVLQFNGQIIYLEKYLNDVYDPVDMRIYIQNTSNSSPTYLFNRAELNDETYLFNRSEAETEPYLYNRDEASGIDYVIFVPTEYSGQEDSILAGVKQFNLANKTFNIIFV